MNLKLQVNLSITRKLLALDIYEHTLIHNCILLLDYLYYTVPFY